MKNKFLLLGATALLSTGAILANADPLPALPDASATLEVRISLYNAAGITVKEDTIDFGTLAATGDHTGASVRLMRGIRTITGSGVVAAGGEVKTAYLYVAVPTGYKATLSLPQKVTLQDTYSEKFRLTFVPEKILDEEAGVGDIYYNAYDIGGSIDLSDEFHGDYTGSFTVTAVYEVDPDYTPEP